MEPRSRHSKRKGVFMKGQLKLSVYLNYGLVTVHVVQGRHISSGSQLQPDTFVMISLIPDDDGVAPTRCRTGVVKNSSCPVFNEKFSFEVGEEDESRRVLIAVWNRNPTSGSTEFMGCMSFGVYHLPKSEVLPETRWYQLLSEATGCRKHLTVPSRNRPPLPVLQTMELRPSPIVEYLVPEVNQSVPDDSRHVISVLRSSRGSFGFSVVEACPAKVGRVDGSSCAEMAGLRTGDLIIRVNGENVSRSTSVSVSKCIRSRVNVVDLEIHRPSAIPPTHTPLYGHVAKATSSDSDDCGPTSVQDYTLYDDRAALVDSTVVSFNPFRLLRKLRTKTCYAFSHSRPIRL